MSKIQVKDETLFCERCGISFIWAVEEQNQVRSELDGAELDGAEVDGTEQQPPSRCTGCRYLMPIPNRERGRVLWYNPRKRFGFIVRRDHPEIFMHGANFEGRVRIHPGDLVEFSMGETARGPCASEIRLLSRDKGDGKRTS